MQRFARHAPQNPISLMIRYYRYILPEVRATLSAWKARAEAIPDPELRRQALASINSKQFHCEGGAVYAAADIERRSELIPLIVAFQTISDYLDNLCDRSTSLDGADFRQLHQSMLDAVDPSAEPADYYAFHAERDDGGYLRRLVQECQRIVAQLPSYPRMQAQVSRLVGLYCDLQVYKHIRRDWREDQLIDWWSKHRDAYPDILWNEFAAASGSTLGVFMLFTAALDPQADQEDADRIAAGYFPYICGLHILLDYLIDQEEDRTGGDLNFCYYYDSPEHAAERIGWVADQAKLASGRLAGSGFHKMIVEGLMALYLSDPKVRSQASVKQARRLLMRKSPLARIFFWYNSIWVRSTQ